MHRSYRVLLILRRQRAAACRRTGASASTIPGMTQHRVAVVAWSGAVAGAAIAAAALFAGSLKHPFATPWLVSLVVIGAVAFLILVAAGIPDVTAWITDGFELVLHRERHPELEMTRWCYTSEGMSVPGGFAALEVAVPGSNDMVWSENPRPVIRYAILLGCGSIGTEFDVRGARDRFLRFLAEPPVLDLINALTTVPDDASWSKRATHDSAFDAILTRDDDEVIVSARLELPDGTHRFGRNTRAAIFIIHVEASNDNDSCIKTQWLGWVDRIADLLRAVPYAAQLLSDQMGLEVSAELSPTVAVRLETPKDLSQLIGTAGLDALAGKQHLRQAIGYFIASSGGCLPQEAAEQMVQHVLRYALQADI
jgi:hypothetical protein